MRSLSNNISTIKNLPTRFSFQLVLLFILSTSAAIVAFTYHSVEEQSEYIVSDLKSDAKVLADNLAGATAVYLLDRDYTSIENLLVRAAHYRSIIDIQVSDLNGRLVGNVIKNPDGSVTPRFVTTLLTLPESEEQRLTLSNEEIEIWRPVILGELIGWIKIRYSLQVVAETKAHLWDDNITDGIIIIFGVSFFLLVCLSRPTLTLARYTVFADKLDSKQGEQVEVDHSSFELRKLGNSLNLASTRLESQERIITNMLHDLTQREMHYRTLFDCAADAIFLVEENKYIDCNPIALRMLGCSKESLMGYSVDHCYSSRSPRGSDSEKTVQEYFNAALYGQQQSFEWQLKRANSSVFDAEVSLNRIELEGRDNILVIARDITERKKAEARLIRQANFDTLTELPNRVLAFDRLAHALTRAHREKSQVSILFVDIDHFKTVNDTIGHAAGDELLIEIAYLLSQCARAGDTVARLGGDEFLIVLDGVYEFIEPRIVAENILEVLATPLKLQGQEFFLGASIGIATYPIDGNDPHILLRNADSAMYQAKNSGRNTYQFYTAALNESTKQRVKMEGYLRYAIENNELYVMYQPQLDTQTGMPIGAEALIRWQHPELGNVSPAEFIPIAEDSGLIVDIGQWVLKTACNEVSSWQMAGHPPLRVAVNVSPRQFMGANLIETVTEIMRETAVSPELLELELTESLLVEEDSETINILNALKALGLYIALDDFGTGYSSLSYLKKFPFDMLKIDQSFVRDIVIDADDAALCEAIIAITKSLNMKVIGEGVETIKQLEFLTERGTDIIQGYHYSKPLNADEFRQFITSQRTRSITKNFTANSGAM